MISISHLNLCLKISRLCEIKLWPRSSFNSGLCSAWKLFTVLLFHEVLGFVVAASECNIGINKAQGRKLSSAS